MLMFCEKCGKEITANAKFCPYCGASRNIAGRPGPGNEGPVRMASQNSRENYYQPYSTVTNTKWSKPKKVGMIACVVAVLLVIVTIAAGNANNPANVVEKYIKASTTSDYETMLKYSAADINSVPREYREYWENMIAWSEGIMIEALQSEYGKNYRITTSGLKATRLSSSDMKKAISSYKYAFDFYSDESLVHWDKIKEMSIVSGKLTISGSKRKDTTSFEMYCVKIDGKWKVLGDPDLGF